MKNKDEEIEAEEWRKQMLLGKAFVSNEITEKEIDKLVNHLTGKKKLSDKEKNNILDNRIISSNVKERIKERVTENKKMKTPTKNKSIGLKIIGWIGILLLGYLGLAVVLYTIMLILELFAGVNMIDNDPVGNFGYLVGSGIAIYLIGTFIVYRPIKWIYNKIK